MKSPATCTCRAVPPIPGSENERPRRQVRMSGVVDLIGEGQNLRVNIQPRLDDSMALAGAWSAARWSASAP